MGLLSSLREWWRWRTRRAEVHIYGIAEFRTSEKRALLVPMKSKVRFVGLLLITVYWSSFLLTSSIAERLEHESDGSGAAVRILWDVYRMPPMLILGSLRYVLPYPEFMFFGPLIALGIGFATTSVLWWLLVGWRKAV
jgi:hypothetical protein